MASLSSDMYEKMIAEVEDYAIILLDENGNIRNWNAGAEKIKGYKAGEIIGKNFRIFYLPEDRDSGLPQKLITQASLHGKATHEGWRVRKDGTRFWGSIVITAVHDHLGMIIGFSKVTRDLTERKMAEERQEKYLKELQDQNEELERFAYIASHDLQEPLRKIQTFIDVIGENLHNQEITMRMFAKIDTSTKRMSALISAILNYSRIGQEGQEKTNVDLNLVLIKILDDFERVIKDKNAIIINEGLPDIVGIEIQLEQVFSNLIGNALKFSTVRPEIRISSHVIRIDGNTHPTSDLPSGEYREIIFSDKGIGFDQEYSDKIFLVFQRLHARQQFAGTGIGLALCKRIMENHGGAIFARSQPGNGAQFHLYFPLH